MVDFTLKIYRSLLQSLLEKDFSFQSFGDYMKNPLNKVIILRHDVDLNPSNSLIMAGIESELGIRGSYYFRIVPASNHPEIIRKIGTLEHEIGYHYEDLSLTWEKMPKKDKVRSRMIDKDSMTKFFDLAIHDFTKHLEYFRQFHPVNTICMHGSPMSRWDSRLLWKYYDYKDFGIIGEPYFDIDFNETLYLTDTARRWDGEAFSIRDKAIGDARWVNLVREEVRLKSKYLEWKVIPLKYRRLQISHSPSPQLALIPPGSIRSTSDIINAAKEGQLPVKIMITLHPQRWTDKPGPWLKELVWQNIKNPVKHLMVLTSEDFMMKPI